MVQLCNIWFVALVSVYKCILKVISNIWYTYSTYSLYKATIHAQQAPNEHTNCSLPPPPASTRGHLGAVLIRPSPSGDSVSRGSVWIWKNLWILGYPVYPKRKSLEESLKIPQRNTYKQKSSTVGAFSFGNFDALMHWSGIPNVTRSEAAHHQWCTFTWV